jgi:hypothetical protein
MGKPYFAFFWLSGTFTNSKGHEILCMQVFIEEVECL